LALVCFLGVRYGHAIFGPNVLIVVIYGMIIWPLLVFLAVNMVPVRWVLSRKPFAYLGKISFSMYLIHFPVMVLLDDANVLLSLGINYASKRAFALYVVLLMVISILCYYFVERKLTNYFKGVCNEKKL